METVTSRDGTRIAYQRTGQGPGLVLVGGALSDRSAAAGLAAALASHFTVLAYDRRGRGDSGDTPPFALEREFEDLAAVLSQAGPAPRAFGHSSGGVLAVKAAAAGVPMAKLAVYEPPFMVGERRPPADVPERTAALLAAGDRAGAVRLFWREDVGVPEAMMPMMEASPYWGLALALAHTLPYDMALCGPDFALPAEAVGRIRVPTLVMDGGASPSGMREGAAALAAAIPGARYATLPGQTHGPADAVLVPKLVEFLGG